MKISSKQLLAFEVHIKKFPSFIRYMHFRINTTCLYINLKFKPKKNHNFLLSYYNILLKYTKKNLFNENRRVIHSKAPSTSDYK